MLATQQRKMILDDPTLTVLSTIADARAKLPGHDEDDILALIEEGIILHAWNIALKKTAAREIRILPACIDHYKSTGGARPFPIGGPDPLAPILATDKPFILGARLKLILNCGATHIINLVDAKLLRVLPGTKYQRGPNGSPVIEMKSLLSFMQARQNP